MNMPHIERNAVPSPMPDGWTETRMPTLEELRAKSQEYCQRDAERTSGLFIAFLIVEAMSFAGGAVFGMALMAVVP